MNHEAFVSGRGFAIFPSKVSQSKGKVGWRCPNQGVRLTDHILPMEKLRSRERNGLTLGHPEPGPGLRPAAPRLSSTMQAGRVCGCQPHLNPGPPWALRWRPCVGTSAERSEPGKVLPTPTLSVPLPLFFFVFSCLFVPCSFTCSHSLSLCVWGVVGVDFL